jgi:hypothetical protein
MDYIGLFVVASLFCALSVPALVLAKLFRVVKVPWIAIFLLCCGLLLVSWLCINTAHQISASI